MKHTWWLTAPLPYLSEDTWRTQSGLTLPLCHALVVLQPSDSEALLLSKRQGMMMAVLNVLGQVEGRSSPQESRRFR